MSKLDNFFNLIKDGAWHSITQLSKELSLPTEKLAKVSEILSEEGLVQYREEARLVKINSEWSSMLFEEDEEREEEIGYIPTVGTIIIPSRGSVTVQNVRITNVTGREVELGIKISKKLTEIAIN